MRVIFHKTESLYFYSLVGWTDEADMKRWNNIYSSLSNSVDQKLLENFASVKWTKNTPSKNFNNGIYFYFEDPADEAFFLVWSSDGIEI